MNQRRTYKQLLAIACLALWGLILGTGQSLAQQSLNWTNTTGSPSPFFDTNTNWDPNSTPTPADSVFFSEAATYDVWWDGLTGDRTVDTLTVFAGDVTFLNINDTTIRYNLAVTTDIVLMEALTIEGIQLDVQRTAAIAGTLTVDGSARAGSSVNSEDILSVFLGGTMNINNGGEVTTSGDGTVADATVAGDGTVNIDGAGSQWNIAGELRAGVNGRGLVNVTGGGLLTSNGGVIDDANLFTRIRIDGAGSQWTNTGSLTMQEGLIIDNGGTVSVAGTIQNNNLISIGGSGGTLIAPEGITNNDNIFISGTNSVIDGSVTNNSNLETFGGDNLTITGDLTHSAALLNSGLLSEGTTRIEGSYNGGGFLRFDNAGVVIVAGDYLPADVTGPETGFVQFEGASLQMESSTTTFIDLAAANDHDQILAVTAIVRIFDGAGVSDGPVHPDVTLAGDLQINLLNGFTLGAGQTFEIVDFNGDGTISGSFANFAEGDVVLSDNGFDLVISYMGGDGDDVVLTTVGPTVGPKGELIGNTLTVTATPGDDTIDVTRTGVADQVSVVVNDCPEEIYDGVEELLVLGLAGNDTIDVDFPNATIEGGAGNDVITGGPAADIIMGGTGMDDIDGMGGADTIYGNSDVDATDTARNILSGGDGGDFIDGTDRVDIIDGGRGNDEIYGREGSDVIDGFHGSDFISGGNGADDIKGGLGADEILGGPGNDTILGQDGGDMLFGGTGIDTISGGSGNDTISGQGGEDVLSGNAGADTLIGGVGNDEMFGGTENDTLIGQGGSDIMLGQGGNDQFTGGPGFDSFNGGPGFDTATDNGEAGEVGIEN